MIDDAPGSADLGRCERPLLGHPEGVQPGSDTLEAVVVRRAVWKHPVSFVVRLFLVPVDAVTPISPSQVQVRERSTGTVMYRKNFLASDDAHATAARITNELDRLPAKDVLARLATR